MMSKNNLKALFLYDDKNKTKCQVILICISWIFFSLFFVYLFFIDMKMFFFFFFERWLAVLKAHTRNIEWVKWNRKGKKIIIIIIMINNRLIAFFLFLGMHSFVVCTRVCICVYNFNWNPTTTTTKNWYPFQFRLDQPISSPKKKFVSRQQRKRVFFSCFCSIHSLNSHNIFNSI